MKGDDRGRDRRVERLAARRHRDPHGLVELVADAFRDPHGLASHDVHGARAERSGEDVDRSARVEADDLEARGAGVRAIGLSPFNVLKDIILPQAIRKILPPLAGQFITLIKDSSIVSLISIQELTFLAVEVAASTTRVFETWIVVGMLYFAMCYPLALLFARLEKRMQKGRR